MLKKDLAFLLALVVILFGVYWKTFNYDLIWDDEVFFKHNVLFIENRPVSSAFKFGYFSEQLGVQGQDHYYRPLLTASFLLENKLWGIHNATMRLTNLLIFLAGLTFFYYLLKRQGNYRYFPEIGTLLFALYPLNMDNIIWIVGRGDLLLLLWGMLCLLLLDLAMSKKRWLYLSLSSACYLLGIFCKETFLLFFPLLLLYEAVKRKRLSLPYHLTNLGLTLLFFFLKSFVLDIKSLGFVFNRPPGEGLRALAGTVGYYIRTMIFPLRYDMFLLVQEAMKGIYVAAGLVGALLILFLLVRSAKNRALLVPAALLTIFLAAHVLLVFSNIYPYQIYSRYMMIPGLALVWILAAALKGMAERPRFVLAFGILVLFIPAIVLNGGSYKNAALFWARAQRSSPHDGYVLFQSAKTAFQNRDYLSAELALNRSLSPDVIKTRETAILLSSLYTDVEITRADYVNALRWIHSIEEFETVPNIQIAPFVRYQLNEKKALVAISEDRVDEAVKCLEDNIARFSTVKESYARLYDIYIGRGLWEKATALEQTMKAIYPRYFGAISTARLKQEFQTLPFDKKLEFDVQHRNFEGAISLVRSLPALDLDHRLLLAKLYYYRGAPEQGEAIVAEIIKDHPTDPAVSTKIGYFYVGDLLRAKEAVLYFDRSLSLNKSQPDVIFITNRLKNDYLARLKPVWQ